MLEAATAGQTVAVVDAAVEAVTSRVQFYDYNPMCANVAHMA